MTLILHGLRASIRPGAIQFSLDDLGGLGGIARWFAIADKHPVAIGSLASQRSGQFSYVENRLQNVTNAAETYHRGRFTNGVMPKQDFKTLRQSLVSCVPSEHQEWLNEKLAHANEKRLHDRFLELTEYIGDRLSKVIPDSSLFCKQVTSQRNSIAHDDTPKRRLEATRLHQLSEAVYFLVVLCLLKDMEMRDDVLDRVVDSVPLATLAWHLAR